MKKSTRFYAFIFFSLSISSNGSGAYTTIRLTDSERKCITCCQMMGKGISLLLSPIFFTAAMLLRPFAQEEMRSIFVKMNKTKKTSLAAFAESKKE